MKTFKGGYLVGLLLLAIGCLSFAGIRSKQRKISDIDIIFNGGDARFLSVDIVNKLLIQSNDSLFFQQKDMVALNMVEQQFVGQPVIKNAELYTVPQGKLYVEIEERLPIVRIQAKKGFYLDDAGQKIPLSERYTAKVPLFYGELKEENMHALVQLISKFSSDAFLADEVIDYQWENNAFIIGLRSYPFEVVWGKNNAFDQKVEKLKRFCAYVMENKDKTFNRINLTYANQVVARHNEGYGK